jgi:lactoylglutathione lyase
VTLIAVIYVNDVSAAVAFYENVLGLERDHIDDDGSYGELRGGIAFAANWHVARHLTIPFRENDPSAEPAGFGLDVAVGDVDAAFQRALDAGAQAVWQPQDKPWGRSAMFRDPNGVPVQVFEG